MALRRMKSAQQRRGRGTAGASVNGGDATAPPQTLGVVARIECKASVRQSAKTAILYRTENMRLDAMQSLNPNYLSESGWRWRIDRAYLTREDSGAEGGFRDTTEPAQQRQAQSAEETKPSTTGGEEEWARRRTG